MGGLLASFFGLLEVSKTGVSPHASFKNGHFWARTWRLQKCRKICNFQKKIVFLKFSRFLKTAIWPQTSLKKWGLGGAKMASKASQGGYLKMKLFLMLLFLFAHFWGRFFEDVSANIAIFTFFAFFQKLLKILQNSLKSLKNGSKFACVRSAKKSPKCKITM